MMKSGAIPFHRYPAVHRKRWDGDAARRRLKKWATRDGKVDFSKFREGFAYEDPEHAGTLHAYKLPHHDIVNGDLVVVDSGVRAAGNALMGSRGGVDIPQRDYAAVRRHLAREYELVGLRPPWREK